MREQIGGCMLALHIVVYVLASWLIAAYFLRMNDLRSSRFAWRPRSCSWCASAGISMVAGLLLRGHTVQARYRAR